MARKEEVETGRKTEGMIGRTGRSVEGVDRQEEIVGRLLGEQTVERA
jgi:hypothetical protein